MNKLNSRQTTLQIPQKTGSSPQSVTGQTPLLAINKGPLPPIFPQYAGDPPLRAAQGDDDLMSEEPWVNERG